MSEILSEKSCRAKPLYVVLPFVVTVFWIGVSVLAINYFYSRTGRFTSGSVLAVLLVGVVLILISGAGIWQGLAYWRRFRLTLSQEAITKVVGTETNMISMDEISHLNWRSISGEIIISSAADKIRINLDHFKRRDQRDIIGFLRTMVPLEQQEKWEPFSAAHRHTIDPHVPLTRRERLVTAFWLIATVLIGYQWWIESAWPYLMMALTGVWLTIRSYRGT
ncbi:hypothetical protein Pan241w_29320 [Gimesia alba]|uniref:Uncharacterized protein n=1 Tax=Gimesia alba TaxID=2527973 RepID=A0A517RG36_9PLAN|nr:hypothetical protein [Gimesia alba]QDT42843.1 hypothetical protein Pan241w_29320 [Gimesia alba]